MSDPRKAALAAYVAAIFVDPAVKARVVRAWSRSPEAAAWEVFLCVKDDVEVVGAAHGRAFASRAVDAGGAFLGGAVERAVDVGRAAVGEALQGIARGLKDAIAGRPEKPDKPRGRR